MNKVFKVIWSDARSAYVVVSEMAKSHGTKSCSTKKLLAMLLATGVMTCASMAPAMAANLAPTDTKIEAGDGASASGQGSVAIGNNAQASGLVGIAIGRDAIASGTDSIAIGSQTKADQTFSVAVGNDIKFTAYAGTAVGQQAYASGDNATAIGTMTNVDADYNRTHDDWRKAGAQSTAIGAYAGSWGLASTAVGGFSKAEGKLATAVGYNSKANVDYGTALGDYSEVTAGWDVAIGASSVADRESGVVGAFAPEDTNSRTWIANGGAVSVGSATLTRQITNVAAGTEATDAVNVAQLKAATEDAGWNLSTGKEITNPTKVKSGDIVDFSGDENITVSKEATDYATLVNVKLNKNLNVDSVQAGDYFMDSYRGIGVGRDAYITEEGLNANGKVITNVAKGQYNTDAVNVGQLKEVEEVAANANKGWNLSTNGVATEATNVAPGEIVDFSGDKNISVSHDGTKVKVELNKNLKDIETISNGGATLTLGAMGGMVSEFANGKGASVKLFGDTTTINGKVNVYKNGRIAGVADGVNANDAVNVGQLKNSAWKLAANGVLTEAEDVKAGDYVDFNGDQNVSVSKDAKDGVKTVKVELNKDLKDIESISNDGASLTLNGTATELTNGKGAAITLFGDTTTINNKVTVYNDGRISGVAAGIRDNDAVNVSQLKNSAWKLAANGVLTEAEDVKADDYVDFSGDQNVSVSKDAKDGVKTVKVELNKDLKDIESISNDGASLTLNGTATELTNGKGAAITLFGDTTTINNKVTVYNDGRISGVAAGIRDNDAVNVSQLKAVGTTANMGWNLATNGVATEATNVKPGDFVDFSGDKNISVSHDGTKVKVELNKDIDVNSVQTNALNSKYNLSVGTMAENGIMPFFVNSTGDFYAAHNKFHVDKDGKVTATAGEIGNVVLNNGVFYKNSALRDGELFIGDADGNYSQITPKSAKLGKVTIDKDGKISGVAAGAVTADSTDAVNGSQLHAVATEAGKHSKVVNGSNITVEETDQDGQKTYKVGLNKDILLGDITGKNVSISGTNGTIETTGYIATKDRVYADKGAKLGKVTVAEDGKISGVAAGAVTADSTDAVNGSQLHAVATEAGKHSKVVNGSNINVEEFDNDGQKIYKVNLNKDIMLGDLTGKYVNISGTNGTIETTGYIATKDRVYADKGAKLADIDVTGDKISNGASSIVLDGSNVKVNDKVTIDQNGKISGVAAGEISSTSTDAINGSQLHQTNENVAANRADIDKNKADIAALDNRVTKNEADIAANRADIDKNKADIAANRTDIDKNAADIAQNKTDIKNLDNRVTNVEELAKKHTTVTQGDNITVTEGLNADGGKEYNVALDKDINLDSVTTGQTVMNNDGLKVGKDVSVTATAVTAGKTSISDKGVKVGDKTYISADGLNASDQKVTNVVAGELSATSKDAVNGSQLYQTNQEVANNTNRINKLGSRVNKVGAGAAALAALHPLDFDPDAKWDFAAGYGNYNGENAAAIGAYYRPNEDTMFSVGGSFGNGENMVNAGVSFKLGSGSSHVSTSRVAMAKEIKELRGELEAMKSAMLDANAGKKIDTSKLQLFPDVPQNHWAYEYVAQLAGNGMIEGYPDGNFAGDRPMTRYEFAAILYRAMMKGAVLSDKILSEFSHELEYFTVDTVAKDKAGNPTIQRVRTVKENKNK